jgi:competence protein ComFB
MYELKNYTEVMVNSLVDSVLKDYPDLCKCSKCVLDIEALALDKLPSRYVVTRSGEVFKKLDELDKQYYADTVASIVAAAMIVKEKPMHDIE